MSIHITNRNSCTLQALYLFAEAGNLKRETAAHLSQMSSQKEVDFLQSLQACLKNHSYCHRLAELAAHVHQLQEQIQYLHDQLRNPLQAILSGDREKSFQHRCQMVQKASEAAQSLCFANQWLDTANLYLESAVQNAMRMTQVMQIWIDNRQN